MRATHSCRAHVLVCPHIRTPAWLAPPWCDHRNMHYMRMHMRPSVNLTEDEFRADAMHVHMQDAKEIIVVVDTRSGAQRMGVAAACSVALLCLLSIVS